MTSSAAKSLPSLTGLRFVAAIAVFGYHIHAHGVFADPTVRRVCELIFTHAPAWMTFFFVLSGFVLTWTVRPTDTVRSIWRKRAARIYPNHVVTWLLSVIALTYAGHTLSAGTVLPGLFLLQSWVPNPELFYGGNAPAWSLSCEAAFYAAFPLLVKMLGKVSVGVLWPFAAALVAMIFLCSVAASAMSPWVGAWFIGVFPLTRMLEFILGIVLARIVKAGLWIPLGLWTATLLLCVGFASLAYVPGPFAFTVCAVIPVALFVPAVATADITGRRTPWGGKRLVWLGELSFAFYLLHQLVIRTLDKLAGERDWGFGEGTAIALAMFVITLVGSWMLLNVVEKPMMRLLNRGRVSVPASALVSARVALEETPR